jgi:uncharacterized protein
MRAIADTGFLIAFLDRNDRHHGWALSVMPQLETPLLTCEPVLAETAFHMESATFVLELFPLKMLQIAFDCGIHIDQLSWLAKRYADRRPDLADLCLIRMSELYPKHIVLTVDERDFRVYRRNKRETIPLVTPSSRYM